MRRILLTALLLAGTATLAQAQRYPMGEENGKRWMIVPLPDGSTRKIYLDGRTCEELTDAATCATLGDRPTRLTPPSRPTDTTPASAMPPPPPTPAAADAAMTMGNTIADVAMRQPTFSKLVAALQAAGLVDALKGAGPFTVFAPTDEAFDALQNASNLSTDQLRTLLQAHVIAGEKLSAQTLNQRAGIATNHTEQTMAGPLPTAAGQEGYTIGGASVVRGDIEASNGVIHVVNRVIVPESLRGAVGNR